MQSQNKYKSLRKQLLKIIIFDFCEWQSTYVLYYIVFNINNFLLCTILHPTLQILFLTFYILQLNMFIKSYIRHLTFYNSICLYKPYIRHFTFYNSICLFKSYIRHFTFYNSICLFKPYI